MLGVVFGALAVIGVLKVARRAMWRRRGYYAMGCSRGGWSRGYDGGWDEYGDGAGYGDYGDGVFLRALFERLDASPAQEKAIRKALGDLRAKGREVRQDVRGARGDLASAFRAESIDAETLGTAAHRATSAVDALRDATIGALVEVHAALDERQRGFLADAIERGPRAAFRSGRRSRRGGYRAWAEA